MPLYSWMTISCTRGSKSDQEPIVQFVSKLRCALLHAPSLNTMLSVQHPSLNKTCPFNSDHSWEKRCGTNRHGQKEARNAAVYLVLCLPSSMSVWTYIVSLSRKTNRIATSTAQILSIAFKFFAIAASYHWTYFRIVTAFIIWRKILWTRAINGLQMRHKFTSKESGVLSCGF